ncbi:hypothetical protein PGUG_02738 [Meyerozyma guilliermondii ATCC 6260]|uniref:Flavoprotein domain-containing protein n=1 Tax=Meyerozyma guilliermondii (strain ATCC 6260 / CBS 566 / DSM 6381 / JCM 1539 / NBRC 10279 / NRRL Y-324) TaxID=294746 RepID=A5DHI7_PICGU|nr:uncharacterized protein PGUG_02738 [Meyerozyma guilliermondii ATCC 6260]EDK38640.2 hypothetical protein PGUG_02738 [Meyerozyma guilliermondii ATCC 6260]
MSPTTVNHHPRPQRLPSLSVKVDPTLKSCLSSTNVVKNTAESASHPSFVVENNDCSPNLHGLYSGACCDEDQVKAPTPVVFSSKDSLPLMSRSGSIVSPPLINQEAANKKRHLLIGITGCISIHKNVFLIIEKLFELYGHERLEIQVVLTKSAEWFLTEKLHKFDQLGVKVWFHNDGIKQYLTSDIYSKSGKMNPAALPNHTMLPFALQRWADMFLLAPLSANTLAKAINGLSDSLLTDILRIWHAPAHSHNDAMYPCSDNTVLSSASSSAKPLLAAVALTNSMYSHPITKRQLVLLKETFPNICILKPVEKCVDVDGNIAMGGMRSWREVVDFVTKGLGEPEEEEDGEEDDTNDDDRSPTSNLISIHHHRSTLSSKEIQEHERLASQNAILNSGVGFEVSTASSMLSERA